jgi:hypothetical protein
MGGKVERQFEAARAALRRAKTGSASQGLTPNVLSYSAARHCLPTAQLVITPVPIRLSGNHPKRSSPPHAIYVEVFIERKDIVQTVAIGETH